MILNKDQIEFIKKVLEDEKDEYEISLSYRRGNSRDIAIERLQIINGILEEIKK